MTKELDHLQKLLRAGHQALAAGDVRAASQTARKLLDMAPKLVPGHFLVGLIALASRDYRTAIAAMKTVVSLDTKHAAGWAQLARAFMMGGLEDNAVIALSKARELSPTDPAVLDAMGTVYSLLEEQQKAHQLYGAALANTDALPIRLNRAKTSVFLGLKDQAREDLSAVLAAEPHHAEALWMLARLETVSDEALLDQLRDALTVHSTGQAAAYVHYGLGKALEDLGEWTAAFNAYSAGAAAKRKIQPFDRVGHQQFFDALEAAAQNYDPARGHADFDQQPIFVLGQPRTGTTLVEQIIAANTAVYAAGELPYAPRLIKAAVGEQVLGPGNAAGAAKLIDVDCTKLGSDYLVASRRRSAGAAYFTDKLPSNFHYTLLLAEALPNAKFVHVKRGALDSIFASYKQLFADAYPHSYHLLDQTEHWLRYHRLMKRYKALLGDRLIEVQYEHLVQNVAGESQALYASLGFQWTPDVLNFHRKSAAVTTASAAQVREKVHSKSVGRWRKFEPQLVAVRQHLEAAGLDFAELAPD